LGLEEVVWGSEREKRERQSKERERERKNDRVGFYCLLFQNEAVFFVSG